MARVKGGMSVKHAICQKCGETFSYKVLGNGLCSACIKKAYKAKKEEERRARDCRKRAKSSLERAVDEVAKYNREHGTSYTYGEYIGKFGVK